ncbi:hypothetical protein SAMN02745216_02058 [Desulfatibacillum alkenivorans DSM 16219]|uniref:Dolichyl-phosphate-mannose-protein mannosyltransferase n=1 Tax=Desulfatibacillum alkenivorans DSM 16219 TaxID=1121393 RepID=A0A1M6L7V9_9BACT|nr:hypothetical protein [Desulfatibacillum alkenivorans]SHJ67277.1 hypothetical protein SAMN02745216_02058 [Desulfatibacillum alkenivorans DSM 16219]
MNKKSGFQNIAAFCLSAIPWLAFLGAITQNTADPDLFGYLAFGRLFFESHGFPYEDVFSYYPVKSPWVYHEWLTGVFFYKLYTGLGAWAIQSLKYALALGFLGLAWKTARLSKADGKAVAAAAMTGVWVLAQGWSPVRAQAFTYFFFALTLYALERARLHGAVKMLWAAPVLFLFWCNLHGGFPAGLGVLAIYACWFWAGGIKREAAACTAALAGSVLATLANPYGVDYWAYLAKSLFMDRPFIVEWWPLPKTLVHGFYLPASVFTLILFLCAAVMLPKMFKDRNPGAVLLPVLAGLAFLHHRHGIFFVLGFIALAPGYLSIRKPKKIWGWAAAALAAFCLAGNMLLAGYQSLYLFSGSPLALNAPSYEQAPANAPYYPSGAADYLLACGMQGNVLTDFHWGEYLIWRLHPNFRVGVDGRYETVFPEGIVNEHFLCFENPRVRAKDFFAYLEKYPTDTIITTAQSAAHILLAQNKGWRLMYQDPGSALFVRDK